MKCYVPLTHFLTSLLIGMVLMLCANPLCAQKAKTCQFTVQVHDKVSNRQLNRVRVLVQSATDSTTIDSLHTLYMGSDGGRDIFYVGEVKSAEPTFLLRLEREGYQPLIIRTEAKPEVYLTQVQMEREVRLRNLNEAVVSATKIKMVMRGDTVVYNADAFELGEGSMLDQLISQLPGVKLEKGGVITLNGNKVSSLLINGKDLFNGDVQKAMENLPAYIVDKVKAYQRAPDDAYLTRREVKAEATDPWVIDVNLKKDYNQGWLVSAEGGYGLNSRYMGRLFALRFTNQTELFGYGSANNLNDRAKPWGKGNWYKDEQKNGQLTLYKGGIYFGLNSRNNKNRLNTSVDVSRTTTSIDDKTAQSQFYATGDTHSRFRTINNQRDLNLDWTANAQYAGKKAYFTWKHNLRYSYLHTLTDLQSATFSQPIQEAWPTAVLDTLFSLSSSQLGYVSPSEALLINRYRDEALRRTHQWHLGQWLSITLPKWNLFLGGNYDHTTDHSFSQYLLHSASTPAEGDYRNRYFSAPQRSYDWSANINRTFINSTRGELTHRFTASLGASNAHSNVSSTLHRLDLLDANGWNQPFPTGKLLGTLPSAASDSLTLCTDWQNSYATEQTDWTLNLSLNYELLRGRRFSFTIGPRLTYQHRNVNDWRARTQRRQVKKDYTWVSPSLRLKYADFNLSSNIYRQLPDPLYLLDVRSDADPLNISLGNAQLHPADTYNVTASYGKMKRHTMGDVNLSYSHTHNAIGLARIYNTLTGVTTTQPRNINGNYQASLSGNLARELDKKELWEVRLATRFTYQHSVDFVRDGQTALDFASISLDKSTVHNLFTNASAAINYRSKPINVGLKAEFDWQRATSPRESFVTVSSKDIFTTLNVLAKLPWRLELSTDLTLFNRRGYADASMNTDEWIWNATIEKRMLKNGQLSFKCTAFDILRQRRSVERRLNAQGYTETWHNTIPRYVLFTLSIRFHKAPRRSYE